MRIYRDIERPGFPLLPTDFRLPQGWGVLSFESKGTKLTEVFQDLLPKPSVVCIGQVWVVSFFSVCNTSERDQAVSLRICAYDKFGSVGGVLWEKKVAKPRTFPLQMKGTYQLYPGQRLQARGESSSPNLDVILTVIKYAKLDDDEDAITHNPMILDKINLREGPDWYTLPRSDGCCPTCQLRRLEVDQLS